MKGIYKNGTIYEGEGIYIYDDGSKYIGEWKDGKRHGEGILKDKTGKLIFQGKWREGQFSKDNG